MTTNQIALQALYETTRANKAKEDENVRSNKVRENLTRQELIEKERHNKAQETATYITTGANVLGSLAGAAGAVAKFLV